MISSDCHDEKYERDLHDTTDSREDCMAEDVSSFVSNAHFVSDLHERSVMEDDCSQILEDVSVDMFPAMIEKKELKTSCLSLQDTGVVCSPIYDEYADEIDQISISNDVDLSSSPLIYDSYGSDLEESFSLPIKEQYQVEVNHSVFSAKVLSSEFYHEYNLLHQINGQYDCVENFVVEYDTFLKDSKVMSFEFPYDKEQIVCGNNPGSEKEDHPIEISHSMFSTFHEQKDDNMYEKDIKPEGISSQDTSQLFSELQQHIHERIHIAEVDKGNIEQ